MTPRRLATLIALVGLVSASPAVHAAQRAPVAPQIIVWDDDGGPIGPHIIIWTKQPVRPAMQIDIDWGPGPRFHVGKVYRDPSGVRVVIVGTAVDVNGRPVFVGQVLTAKTGTVGAAILFPLDYRTAGWTAVK